MGNFVRKVREEYSPNEENISELKNIPIFKLKEYLANYKMICDTFSINYSEFEQIFDTLSNKDNHNEFSIWDTDNNGLIDSFELFNGIILFGDYSTEEKIKCLFEIYDFNCIQTLAFYDLCFLFENCISCCFKMYKRGISIPSGEIQQFLSGYFFFGQRVSLSELYRFFSEVSEVQELLEIS